MKPVSKVSDPPALSPADVERIQQESQRLREVFNARTAPMETVTADDMRTIIR